ncbi:hypothetical protein Sgleb_67310 [Streptomyces glebosus]|uniref:HTH lysR-type domain-containing protein n=1 Tax=Streptomyces glebosus TaxID=249580 RepID=A0A640T646_9ACTN|nr:LysR family transcriptional regulator [Streptomyces glebosus]GFE18684.1 hypothetical protein Sgleb_67310 [Streptomyces glebosus]GHG87828.1 hypothetical protein GCM10010513_69710 [Streptomyces glebosus]
MEARHLRYALAVAEHQHFGRAAAALGIAQPPLSRQIADLEREVGERLFDRTPGGVFPTAAGTAFLTPARRALCEMSAAAVEAGRAARGETGRLRLGFIGSGVGADLGPSCMRAVARPGTWFCDVTPRTPLPDLVLSYRGDERSPVLAAFLAETRRRSTVGARPGRTKRSARKGPGASDSP